MASFAALLVFAACMHAVWSVKQCYQSSCLQHDLLSCYHDQSVSLKACSLDDFLNTAQQLPGGYLPESENATSMVCVSFLASGEMDYRVHDVVIRMCHPDRPNPCSSLEQYSRKHMAIYGMHNSSLHFKCSSCYTDSCNSAGGPARSTAALLSAVTAAAIVLSVARE